MKRFPWMAVLAAAGLLGAVACGDDDDAAHEPGDAGADGDADSDTDSGADAASACLAGRPGVDFGFAVRVPELRKVVCSEYPEGFPEEPVEQVDSDWICSFTHGGESGTLYVQTTPTDCRVLMGAVPIFEAVCGGLSIDGEVTGLSGLSYDSGGNHANDALEFDHGGLHYKYYHSSFGFGWRACQPMDCLQVYGADGGLVEDGCTGERTLPVACTSVREDGTYDTPADSFAPCPGAE